MAKGMYFEKDAEGRIIGYAAHCIMGTSNVIILTDKEQEINNLVANNKIVLKSKIAAAYLSPREEKPKVVYAAGYKTGKGEIGMWAGPCVDIREVFAHEPEKDIPAYIFHIENEKMTPVYRWTKQGRWHRMNTNIIIENDPYYDDIPF